MRTVHRIFTRDSVNLDCIPDESVQFIFTSPPYPMIEMWDGVFAAAVPAAGAALEGERGKEAFDIMHGLLDRVWAECYRVLGRGCIMAVNIGDATRRLGKDFQLYPNHSRIISACAELGFQTLPCILWRKPTNAPNKFMGSGMLPAGAYVTLEHEYILILRKGGKRIFKDEEEKRNRRESAFFWEERNRWFSDLWQIRGETQKLKNSGSRPRSAAFPLELAFRLVNMYSCRQDTVLDPFAGTGTTLLAAVLSGRNSLGVEIDPSFVPEMEKNIMDLEKRANENIRQRIQDHREFIADYEKRKGPPKHENKRYGFRVVTSQERDLRLEFIETVRKENGLFIATYREAE